MNKFYGTGVAMITPFNADGSIDFDGLKNLINFQIEGGVEYLVSLGTTGESATLSKDEKKAVWEFTAETVAGRVPLVAGIGGNATSEVTESIKKFNTQGYDAILSVSPYYNKPIQEGIYQHYKAIAEVSPLPVILYNVPGRTGSNIAADTTLRLASDFKNIIAIKEASGNFEQFNIVLRDKPEDFLFISGDDPLTLPLIALGAAGVISVAGNALPGLCSSMVRLCLQKKFDEALPIHFRLTNFLKLLFCDGSPGGIKAALKHLNICSDTLRLPLVGVGEATREKITQELEKLK
ncbi:4-hydroxy-tetrahydrodipicolinate synthase [Arcticibacter tournemirensis]|uniref:4-hydroxy-tetrahydrodipicolinate synthase n=1 Tax=Arcticibacter tournemirensis TaxID=699437 RepID=A0A5M9H4N6_9SPHI|nr:4-hydroxy-tetrahydrodipicolinate synthase [Arcticibacter tournemirensis]KAA8481896.1 4-hydroxy-tetrahydrodipicolinate synthase [Arcticibacter tournemirensis]TQM52227.1 4-hydroxy-tetrahydrodipicolinate synthase [Arcticibacter tournemirensis]